VSRWGALLLVLYVGLGLSPVAARKATTLAVGVTVLVVALVILADGGAA
jgi:hypothetical protein